MLNGYFSESSVLKITVTIAAITTSCFANATSLHIVGDQPGPLLSYPTTEAAPYEPEHHVAIFENIRATEFTIEEDDTHWNTGGIAIVLNAHGLDEVAPGADPATDFSLEDNMLNTINRNDHFVTFYRRNWDASTDVIGRIEGVSFWDMGELFQKALNLTIDNWGWFKLDMSLPTQQDWASFQGPSITAPNWRGPSFYGGTAPSLTHPGTPKPSYAKPVLQYNNAKCENDQTYELCVDFGIYELDFTWNPGSLSWGYLDDPLMGLIFNAGALPSTDWGSFGDSPSASGSTASFWGLQFDAGNLHEIVQKIELGNPWIVVDDDAVNDLAGDLMSAAGPMAGILAKMINTPAPFLVNYVKAVPKGGVTYESGAGDYAEWLERIDPDEKLGPGDVVGVFGGKIAKKTKGADHVMVISFKPIVLGNMPDPDHKEHYSKVAFMGQSPVWVLGRVREGDFIIPSGQQDGTAKAIDPERISIEDFDKVIGVAWGSGNDEYPVNLVNVALGLRPVEVAKVVRRQQHEVAKLVTENTRLRADITQMQQTLVGVEGQLAQLEELKSMTEQLQVALEAIGDKGLQLPIELTANNKPASFVAH